MNCYFKPLRRKIGVATLVIAYVFMAGWARSFLTDDVTEIYDYIHYGDFRRPSDFNDLVSGIKVNRQAIVLFAYHGEVGKSVIMTRELLRMPYWLIVIPLTLLSVWLLLGKRRAPIKPTINPASENA